MNGHGLKALNRVGHLAPELRAFGIAFLKMGDDDGFHPLAGPRAKRVDDLAGNGDKIVFRKHGANMPQQADCRLAPDQERNR